MDKFGIKGKLNIKKYEKSKLIEEYNYCNLITDVGLDCLLRMIGGNINGGINNIVLGNGTTPASFSDVRLNNKLILVNINKDYSENGKIIFNTIIEENAFSTLVGFTEGGLVYKSGVDELLITRLVFDDVVYKSPSNSLSLTYSLELNRGV